MAAVTGRAFQVTSPKEGFKQTQREFPDPGPGQVRIRVHACGVCHSDTMTRFGLMPGIQYPRIPGHEIAGVIDAVGPDVPIYRKGMRVGLGWHGGHCNYCPPCRRGLFMHCQNQQVTGISYDGGYSDYVTAPANALARIPDELKPVDAGPLMCAGVTTFNALRHSGARPGDVVAVFGIGGLGHLAVQFGAKFGYRTVAIARGSDKAGLARELGAISYIDSGAQDVAAELQKLGGATVVLSTITSSEPLAAMMGGLAPKGVLLIVGVPDQPLRIAGPGLIMHETTVMGFSSGTGMDSEEVLNFSVQSGVRARIETYPLEKAPAAFDRMESAKARFRVVLETGAR